MAFPDVVNVGFAMPENFLIPQASSFTIIFENGVFCYLECWIRASLRAHRTECIYQLVSESQLPHKNVNLLLKITDQNIESTILWGS